MKYRILEVTMADGTVKYRPQRKVLCFWLCFWMGYKDEYLAPTIEEAQGYITRHKQTKITSERVIGDD